MWHTECEANWTLAKANGSWWFGMENERKKPEIGRISLEFSVCFRFMFIIRPLISLIQTFRRPLCDNKKKKHNCPQHATVKRIVNSTKNRIKSSWKPWFVLMARNVWKSLVLCRNQMNINKNISVTSTCIEALFEWIFHNLIAGHSLGRNKINKKTNIWYNHRCVAMRDICHIIASAISTCSFIFLLRSTMCIRPSSQPPTWHVI